MEQILFEKLFPSKTEIGSMIKTSFEYLQIIGNWLSKKEIIFFKDFSKLKSEQWKSFGHFFG